MNHISTSLTSLLPFTEGMGIGKNPPYLFQHIVNKIKTLNNLCFINNKGISCSSLATKNVTNLANEDLKASQQKTIETVLNRMSEDRKLNEHLNYQDFLKKFQIDSYDYHQTKIGF